jgi:CubicO group peptidase (beta-lactamase class C family)
VTPIERTLGDALGTQITAAVARIEHHGRVVYERAWGVTRDDSPARPIYADTRFDLASLTKLFVSTLVLQLVARERLALDEPLTEVVPEWRGAPHARITPRMLLAHTSGMNSGADYRTIVNENVADFALRAPLVARPGERVIYSDLGFIALGVVLERVAGASLGTVVARSFGASPAFRPADRASIPATEDDGWRGRVQGFVHDEKAYLMHGVAGHAGLFGTAADVASLAQCYLAPLHGRPSSLLPKSLAGEAIAEQAADPVLRRGLGWALKTTDENSCGRYMDRSSFGHTGFVGTSVWADPVRDLAGVLLTNAVYFGRDEDMRDLRAAFYEAMVESVSG